MRTRMSVGVGGDSRKAVPYPDLCDRHYRLLIFQIRSVSPAGIEARA